ncbi:MAG: carboxypeptidase regulatory-like domain-containing protein [Acidobacteria bacterium]|nr:carboxypeptidase regulatory-like domain-containing protein [Acidobacteriota bacterium]MBI3658093.1 carboxypeptidase regulatory-like domain-containing protein [Acidobacteriota bacterium]
MALGQGVPTADIAGTVTSAFDGTPIPGARIFVCIPTPFGCRPDAGGTTDEDGSYKVSVRTVGGPYPRRVEVSAEEFVTQSLEVTVIEGETTIADFELEPKG